MSEFKRVPPLRHDVIVQAVALSHAIQIASPRQPGDGIITLTAEEGGVPALHTWLTQVLGLPDVAQMQRENALMRSVCEAMEKYVAPSTYQGEAMHKFMALKETVAAWKALEGK